MKRSKKRRRQSTFGLRNERRKWIKCLRVDFRHQFAQIQAGRRRLGEN